MSVYVSSQLGFGWFTVLDLAEADSGSKMGAAQTEFVRVFCAMIIRNWYDHTVIDQRCFI